jgi:hypothetical protein
VASRPTIDYQGTLRARINPVASPVDTFVQTKGGESLSQLAEALKGLAPVVGQFSDVQAKYKNQRDKEAGAQKARELFESGKSYRDAIKQGLIGPQDSPWFQLGAKEQFGRV